MSWGTITATAEPDKLETALKAAAKTYRDNLVANDYQLDKLPAANLTGHGNPGHEPKAGFSYDSVSLVVWDTSKAPTV